jgi:hypothetical protein
MEVVGTLGRSRFNGGTGSKPILEWAQERREIGDSEFIQLFYFLFETGSCCIVKAGLELKIILPLFPKYYNYGCVPPRLALYSFLKEFLC